MAGKSEPNQTRTSAPNASRESVTDSTTNQAQASQVQESVSVNQATPEVPKRKSVLFPGFKKFGKKEVCTSIVIPGKGKVTTGFEDLLDDRDFSTEEGSYSVTINARGKSFRLDTIGGPEKYLSISKKLIFKRTQPSGSSCCVLI